MRDARDVRDCMTFERIRTIECCEKGERKKHSQSLREHEIFQSLADMKYTINNGAGYVHKNGDHHPISTSYTHENVDVYV